MAARLAITPALASAAGRDAANAQMRAAGRVAWNRADYNLAARTFSRLMSIVVD